MEYFIFFLAAALALAGALGVVLLRNPAHCALSLVVTLISVAIFFAQLGAALLVAMQIIVYAGAIVVLFLFVIMLLGVDRKESVEEPLKFQRPVALALGVVLLVLAAAGVGWALWRRLSTAGVRIASIELPVHRLAPLADAA